MHDVTIYKLSSFAYSLLLTCLLFTLKQLYNALIIKIYGEEKCLVLLFGSIYQHFTFLHMATCLPVVFWF